MQHPFGWAPPGRHAARAALLLGALALTACGGEDGGGGSGATGQVQLGLTDAEGDFVSYTVDVEAIRLERAGGTTVEALSRSTRVDFAQYVEVTELLTAATVPAGRYTGAEIVLDYSEADLLVQADDGGAVAADALDTGGQPLGEVAVALELNGDSEFVVRRGAPVFVELDFDLEASNEIEIGGGGATVTVTPLLVASTSLEASETLRLRGLLGDVDEAGQAFEVVLRPFRHRRTGFGSVEAEVDGETVYEVDGSSYTGADGLAALAALAPDAAVVAHGTFETGPRRYVADEVYAGSSVPWGDQDIARGTVIARSGDTLTLRGATLRRAAGSVAFRDTLDAVVGVGTGVTRQGDGSGSYAIADISVGQAVTVTGTLDDAEGTLDATAGHVRLRYTSVVGTVAEAGPLAVDVDRINARRVDLYDFAGTGTDPASDADPDAYEIDTGTLPLEGLGLGDPVRIRGFVRPFGSAPEDFEATTVIDVSEGRARMVVGYGPFGSTMAVAGLDERGLRLDLDDAGARRWLIRGGIVEDLATLPAVPLIAPAASGEGVFAIARRGRIDVFGEYAGFRNALADHLDAGAPVAAVHARGTYDSADAELVARHVRVRLGP